MAALNVQPVHTCIHMLCGRQGKHTFMYGTRMRIDATKYASIPVCCADGRDLGGHLKALNS